MHNDILTTVQKTVLSILAPAMAGTDFYMAGGTALALQIGHGPSADFDLFVDRLGEPEKLFRRLNRQGIEYRVQSVDFETVYIDIDSVQVRFIGYKYPMLRTPVITRENIKLAATDDIAFMKLSAIASRDNRKDFVDLHFMISAFRSFDKYMDLYVKKYRTRDIGHLLRSLVYFRDAENEPEVITSRFFDWEKMKADFENWVKNLK